MNTNENLATLAFFTNSKYQGFVANRTGNQKEKHLAELRFYRKRILGLTKDLAKVAATKGGLLDATKGGLLDATKGGLLDATKGGLLDATKGENDTKLSYEEGDDGADNDDGEENGNDDLAKPLLAAYENYALQLIRYFKMLDTKDILQEKYEQMDMNASANNTDGSNIVGDDFQNNNYNDPLLNKRLHVANLDNYVQVKQTTVVKSPAVLPTIVSIDLQTPELKTKGVKKKEKKIIDAPPSPLAVEEEPSSFIEQLLSPPKVVVAVVADGVVPATKKKNKSKKKAEPTLSTVKEDEES